MPKSNRTYIYRGKIILPNDPTPKGLRTLSEVDLRRIQQPTAFLQQQKQLVEEKERKQEEEKKVAEIIKAQMGETQTDGEGSGEG